MLKNVTIPLKYLLIMATLVYCLVIGGGAAYHRYAIVLPALQHADGALMQGDVQSFAAALRSEMSHLRRLAQNWAVWDDAYAYAAKPNSAFINSNMPESTLANGRLACIAILDKNARVIHAVAYDTGTEKTVPAFHYLNEKTLLQLPFNSSDNQSGFITTPAGPVLYALSKIYDSNSSKPSNGYILMLRKIDFELLAEIKQINNIEITDIPRQNWHAPFLSVFENSHTSHLADKAANPDRYLLNNRQEPIAGYHISNQQHPAVNIINQNSLMAFLAFLSMPIVIALITYRLFLYPVNLIIKNIKSVNVNGELKTSGRRFLIHELQVYQDARNELILQQQRHQHQLKHASLTDGLTGIANRRAFDMEMDHIWRSTARGQNSLSLLLCDIDYFKRFNDSLGHQAGDEALQAVALAIRSSCRRATEFCARYGGEEFVIILQNSAADEVVHFTQRLQSAIDELNISHPSSAVANKVTISIGIAHIQSTGEWMAKRKAADLLKLADEALYKSKADGRNRYTLLPFLNH